MLDDLKLIGLCKKGEKEAFEKLITKYYLPLHKFFYKNSCDKKLCEDLTHETVIKLIENIDKFSPLRGAKFSTWLYRIAYNTYVDYLRKNGRAKHTSLENVEMTLDSKYDLQDKIIKKEEKEYLYCKLDKLSGNMKMLITLRYLNGFSYSEISRITGISKTKVKSRLHYSMKKLRKLYHMKEVQYEK